MRAHTGRSAAPHESVHDALRASGRPLDQPVRAHFESRFQQNFSRVRVHTGSEAAHSADAVHARAYTVGSDIVFGAQHPKDTIMDERPRPNEITDKQCKRIYENA